MKQQRDLLIVNAVMAASFLVMNCANGEIPERSREQLQASSSHILNGTVERIYESKEAQGEFAYTYCVAEVAVKRVDKGTDVVANDRIFVRYWRKEWIGNGDPAFDHYGHFDVPAKTDLAEIYLEGDRKTGFDVLSPNGFFKVTKLKTPEELQTNKVSEPSDAPKSPIGRDF